MQPKALDPLATVDFTACGVTFTTRYPTARQQLRVADVLTQAAESGSNAEYVKAMCAAVAEGVTGWNVTHPDDGPVPFNADALLDTFSVEELADILSAKDKAVRLSDDDEKKSKRPAPSNGESSAQAVTATEGVLTPPAPTALHHSVDAGAGI